MDATRQVIRKMYRESIIDPTREKLDPDVFIEEDGQFEMRPEHRNQLADLVADINENIVPVNDWLVKGSILSMQWLPWSDVDILLEIAEDIPDEQWYDIFSLLRERSAGVVLDGTEHPVEFFPQRGDYDEDRADGIYHVERSEWIKGPYDIAVDVEKYRDAFGTEVEKFDKAIGALSRDLADYLIYQSLSDSEVSALSDQVKAKIKEIDDDVGDLVQLGQEVKAARQDAFSKELTPSEIAEYGSRNELPANVVQKLLERYKYMALWSAVRQIREMEGTEAIDHPSEIAALRQRLGVEVGESA